MRVTKKSPELPSQDDETQKSPEELKETLDKEVEQAWETPYPENPLWQFNKITRIT